MTPPAPLQRHARNPFVWLTLLYLLSAKGHLEIIDTEYSIRTALAILEEGSMLIVPVDPEITQAHAPNIEGTDKIYSQYGIGLVIIFLPIALVGKVLSVLAALDQRIIIHFLLSFYNIPFALLALFFFRSILIRLGTTENRANATTVLLGVATAFWKYAVTDFSEVTQVAFLLGALNAVLLDNPHKWRKVSLWCALLVAMKLVYIVLLPVFAVYAWLEVSRHDRRQRITALFDFAVALTPMGLLLALANYLRFDSPFETGYGSQTAAFTLEYFRRDWFDYLFSTQRGIFPFNPILLVALPGWLLFPNQHRSFAGLCVCLCLLWFILMCFWISFQGGWAWGNRLLVPILPLMLLPIAFLEIKSRTIKFGFWGIVGISILFQVAASCTKIHECSVLQNQILAKTNIYTPSQLPSTIRLFTHKLTSGETTYKASVLGVDSDALIDLSSYNSFQGLNLWPVHALNYLGYREAINLGSRVVLVLLLTILTTTIFIHLRLFHADPKSCPNIRTP